MNDLTGMHFGMLTAIKCVGSNKYNRKMWLCKCDCGNETTVSSGALLSGNTSSCGCLKKYMDENGITGYKHGMSKEKLYFVWKSMKYRCLNPNNPAYRNYGGRGISVCEEWANSYVVFKKWAMENGYKDGLTIERKDVNGDYCPENCTWATRLVQARNRRTNVYITYNGETKTVTEWSRETGISTTTIHNRIKQGCPKELVLRKGIVYLGGGKYQVHKSEISKQ